MLHHNVTTSKPNKSQSQRSKDMLWITSAPTNTLRVALALTPKDITKQDITRHSLATLETLFASTRVKPDRFIYALAGCLFDPKSPAPFGGTKTKPGYASFEGCSAKHLLEYIIREAQKVQWAFRQTKAIKLVVLSVNRVMELHFRGMKDEVDELMLKGMKKAGHCEWFGVVRVPEYLRHVDEVGGFVQFVEFVMPSSALKIEANGGVLGGGDGSSNGEEFGRLREDSITTNDSSDETQSNETLVGDSMDPDDMMGLSPPMLIEKQVDSIPNITV